MAKRNLWERFKYLFIVKPKKQKQFTIDNEYAETKINNNEQKETIHNSDNNQINKTEEEKLHTKQNDIDKKAEKEIVEDNTKEIENHNSHLSVSKDDNEMLKEQQERIKKEVPINNDKKEYKAIDYASMLENQEERINRASSLTEEEKQKLIDELYKNFELYVGETNYSKKTR